MGIAVSFLRLMCVLRRRSLCLQVQSGPVGDFVNLRLGWSFSFLLPSTVAYKTAFLLLLSSSLLEMWSLCVFLKQSVNINYVTHGNTFVSIGNSAQRQKNAI